MRSARGFSRLVATAALALGALLVAPAVASAHDELTGSDPEDGVTLTELPAQIRLTFNNPPISLGSQANLTLPSGEQVPLTDLEVTDAVVTIPVPSDAGSGEYGLDWRVVSSDGHPIDGQLGFTVEGDPASSESESSSEPTPSQSSSDPATVDSDATSAQTDDGGFPVVPVVLGVVVVLAVGALVVLRRRGGGQGHPPTG